MSKLTDFYAHRAIMQDASGDMRLEKLEWEKLEEELIREEILPELLGSATTVLQKVKSPLDIHIVYNPARQTSITASRCLVQYTGCHLESESELESATETAQKIDIQDEPSAAEPSQGRSKSIGFSVQFPNGKIIHEKKAVNTFIEALKEIGLSRIASGRHGVVHNGMNVVSRNEISNDRGAILQTRVDGFYIYINVSNCTKVLDLETLGRYYNLHLNVIWDSDKKSQNPIPIQEQGTRDTTKFSLNGGEALPKRRLALAIVKKYCEDHLDTDISKLKKVFPGELISGHYGVVRSLDDMPNISDEEKHKRYFMDDNDAIFLNNDDIIVVCNQWGDNIKGMIEIAEKLGYSVKVVG